MTIPDTKWSSESIIALYRWFERGGVEGSGSIYDHLSMYSRGEVNTLLENIFRVLIRRLDTKDSENLSRQLAPDIQVAKEIHRQFAAMIQADTSGRIPMLLMTVIREGVGTLFQDRNRTDSSSRPTATRPSQRSEASPAGRQSKILCSPVRRIQEPASMSSSPNPKSSEAQDAIGSHKAQLRNQSEPSDQVVSDENFSSAPAVPLVPGSSMKSSSVSRPTTPETAPAPSVESSVSPPKESASSAWKFIPLPMDVPEPHTESDARTGTSAEGYSIVGARVRGKKHKHEGTHCDDWFEFAERGKWTILVVSDGGGSYQFSRCGARIACQTAVEFLKRKLAARTVLTRKPEEWNTVDFTEADLAAVKTDLIDAFGEAYRAVKDFATANADDPSYTRILGRPLIERDLSATLLITLHTLVPYGTGKISLVLGCAVGDGMMSVITRDGRAKLLMTPDSGEHSGEVRFLDERESQPARLAGKVFPFLGTVRTVMLMTDGVADDYFPNEPEMSRLYGDLVFNGVLPAGTATQEDVDKAISGTRAGIFQEISAGDITRPGETPTIEGIQRPPLRSTSAFAERLGMTPAEIVASVPLLVAAERAQLTLAGDEPHEALRHWLDSYQVRGSFDDRTLLLMQK